MDTTNSAPKIGFLSLLILAAASLCMAEPAFAGNRGDRQERRVAQTEKSRKKKKNRRNNKKPAAETAGVVVDAPPPAESEHKEQEGPTDEPYGWQMSLLSDFAINKTQTGDAKGGTANYNLALNALKLATPAFEVGAGLEFDEESIKTGDETATSRTYVLSLLTAYNFGNLNDDKTVFFISAGVGFGGGSAKTADAEAKSSMTRYGVGFGLHYFMDTNVALTTAFSYDAGQIKADGADEATKTNAIHLARIGFSLFL